MNAVLAQSAGSPADVLARIERLPLSRWHGRLFGSLGAAHLFDVFDATALAFALPVLVGLWHLSPTEAGLLLASGYAGQFVGAILFGVLATRYGRISTLQACLIMMATISMLCALAPAYFVLVALRMIQGIGLGGETPIAATYMAEICAPRDRGRMVIAIQLMAATGALAAALAGFLLIPRFGWTALFWVGTAPILLGFALRRILPESPRWLASQGRLADADAALSLIEQSVFRGKVMPPLNSVDTSAAPESQELATLAGLFAPGLARRTLSVWIVGFCASLVGYGIIGWMPTIYRTVYKLPLSMTLAYSLVTGVVSLFGVLLGIFLIDRVGRKPAIIGGFAIAGVLLAFLVLLGDALAPIHIMILASLALAALSQPLAGFYIYAAETYTTNLRSFGTGVGSAWLRLASIVGPPLMGLLLTVGSVVDVYLFLCLTAFSGAVGMAWLGAETYAADDAERQHLQS